MTWTVRRAVAGDVRAIAEVHVASWRTSYRGLVADAYLAALDATAREPRWAARLAEPDKLLLVGAAPDGRLLGFCAAGPHRGEDPVVRGEVYAIYLLDEAKGQGLGRALFTAAIEWLASALLVPFTVVVFAANPRARAFYERMGGVLAGAPGTLELGGATYAEVTYRWDGIAVS